MRRLVTLSLVMVLLGSVAAPVAAQSPTMTEELLAGMVTEEVEPGMYRVLNDGVRDLLFGAGADGWVDIGLDGSVWVWSETYETLQLGDEETYPWGLDDESKPEGFHPFDTLVGPDGTVWYRQAFEPHELYRFDGEAWIAERPGTPVDALAVGSDGRLWAVAGAE